MIRLQGVGVGSGVAFGKAHIVDRRRVAAPHYHVPKEKLNLELDRFEEAIRASEEQLAALRARAAGGEMGQVVLLLDAHAMILRDEALREATRQKILRDRKNAEWALSDTVREIKQLFDGLDEDYFRERRSDVDIVGDRVMRNLIGEETELLQNLPQGTLVVAYDLSPAEIMSLAKFSAKAFVTERGGRTSHAAILARALNIPCVLGAKGVMDLVGSGDEVIVNAQTGEVAAQPTDATRGYFQGAERRRAREERALLKDRELPACTLDGVSIELLGNIEVAQEAEAVIKFGGAGVGLYRTEFLCIERPELSNAADHLGAYEEVLERLDGAPLTIRSFDLGGDKLFHLSSLELEQQRRSQGMRAIRLSLKNPELFKEQLKGVLLASKRGKVRLLLPLVTQLEELREVRAHLQEVKETLEAQGHQLQAELPVGVMIETPASAWIADLLAQEADFLAVGTNDLIGFTLALDRADEDVAHLYKPCHPAVLRTLNSVCKAAKDAQIPISVCGEMAADPYHAPLLLGLGVRALSMTPRSIPVIKRLVRKLSMRECERFAEEALGAATVHEVEEALMTNLKRWAPELFGQ